MKFEKSVFLIISYLKIPQIYDFIRNNIASNHVVIFAYHRVNVNKELWSLPQISPEEFEKQIKYLIQKFKIISLENLVELLIEKRLNNKKYKRLAVITFDDGYKDNYTNAYPILKKYNIPATIFLTSGFIGQDILFWWDKVGYLLYHTEKKTINLVELGEFSLVTYEEISNCYLMILEYLKTVDNRQKDNFIDNLQKLCAVEIPRGLGDSLILSWDEIKEMKENRISFGAHTMTHPILTNIDLEEVKKEIVNSKKIIENKLGTQVKLFAYPNGTRVDFNHHISKIIKDAGFECAVTTIQGLVNKYDYYNIYNLKRIELNSGFAKFKIKVSALYSDFINIISIFSPK